MSFCFDFVQLINQISYSNLHTTSLIKIFFYKIYLGIYIVKQTSRIT